MWVRLSRIAVILLICALTIIYISTWTDSFDDPDELKAADFIAFYAAGRVAQLHGYSSIYEIDLQRNIEIGVRGNVTDQILLYNHLPYFVPVLALIVNDNYHASYTRWVLILLVVFLATTYFLVRALYSYESSTTQLILAGGILTFLPVFISLWQGQDSAFLYLGLALWCAGLLRKNDLVAAAGLALVTVRPHICIVLVLPLIIKHRSVFWRFVALAILAGIYSLLLVGVRGITGFINTLLISAQGEWHGMNPQAMPNITGLIFRSLSFLDHDAVNLISWIIFAIGLGIIVVLWSRSKQIHEPLLGLTVLIAALFAPHLHLHDLAMLIIPLLFAMRTYKSEALSPYAIMILPIASFMLLSGRIIGSLEFVVPYVVAIALAWWLASRMRLEA